MDFDYAMIKSIVIKSLEKIAKEVVKKTSNILSSSVSDYGMLMIDVFLDSLPT